MRWDHSLGYNFELLTCLYGSCKLSLFIIKSWVLVYSRGDIKVKGKKYTVYLMERKRWFLAIFFLLLLRSCKKNKDERVNKIVLHVQGQIELPYGWKNVAKIIWNISIE